MLRMLLALAVTALLPIALASAQVSRGPLPPEMATAGISQAKLEELIVRGEQLAAELGVTKSAVRALAMSYLGDGGRRLSFDEAVQQLDTAIRTLAAYKAEAARHAPLLPPDLLAQRTDAAQLAEGGMVSEARVRYVALVTQARRRADVPTRSLAELYAESARLAAADGDYPSSASFYEAAAELTPVADLTARWGWRNMQANMLSEIGERTGREADLRGAVAAFENSVLPLTSRQDRPLDWATTQNDIAQPLRMLGDLGYDRDAERAIAALQGALEIRTPDDYPNEWAMITINLGIARSALGQRRGDETLLMQAVQDIESAMPFRPRARDPFQWSAAKQNLGGAYQALGDARRDTNLLRRAIKEYEAALEAATHETSPVEWAQIGNNLGAAWRSIALYQDDADAAQRSVSVLRDALTAFDPGINRIGWSRTQANLGASLVALAERGRPQEFLAAFQAFDAALSVLDRNGDAQNWAMVSVNLADAYEARGDTRNNASDYRTALDLLEDVRPVLIRGNDVGYLTYVEAASQRLRGKIDVR